MSNVPPVASRDSCQNSAPPVERRRRWPRWHWLTWLAVLIVAVPMFLLEAPGYEATPTLLTAEPFTRGGSGVNWQDPNEVKGPLHIREHVHGWPLTYLRRAAGSGGKGWPIYDEGRLLIGSDTWGSMGPWDWSLAWWSRVDAAKWSVVSLLVDAVLAFGIVLGVAWGCQTWIRRRGGRIRFRIVDFLGAMVVVGLLVGWRQRHVRLQAEEKKFIATGPMVENPSFNARPLWEYAGPEWLQRLVGDWRLPSCRHVTAIQVDCANATSAQWLALRRLTALQEVSMVGPMSDEAFNALMALPRLRNLRCWCPDPPWDRDDFLYGNSAPTSVLQADNLTALTRLPYLESLELYGKSLLIEDMEFARAMPSLKEIDLRGITATAAEQSSFRDAHSNLIVHCDDPETSNPPRLPGGRGTGRPGLKWQVAHLRTERWRWADAKKTTEYARDEGDLDLQGVQMTAARLGRLWDVLGETTHLSVDKMPMAQLDAIIDKSLKLKRFVSYTTSADDGLLKRLAAMPALEGVTICQGVATIKGFQSLAAAPKLEWIVIINSTFTWEQAEEIEVALPHASVQAYRGADESTDFVH